MLQVVLEAKQQLERIIASKLEQAASSRSQDDIVRFSRLYVPLGVPVSPMLGQHAVLASFSSSSPPARVGLCHSTPAFMAIRILSDCILTICQHGCMYLAVESLEQQVS